MRNLKKILALVLALVMSMSLMATANAALTDLDSVDASYDEAVEVLTALGVFEGRVAADGSTYFAPKGTITRQEVAAILYRIDTGRVGDTAAMFVEAADFADVKATDWAAGYIGYCANGGLVQGYNGKFNPTDNIDGYQVLAMILRAIGYGKNGEFTGPEWQKNVAAYAQELDILDNLNDDVVLSKPATREVVAEILFQAIATVDQVEYTNAFNYQPYLFNLYGAQTIGEEVFGLRNAGEVYLTYGRPATRWMVDYNTKLVDIPYTAKASYTAPVAECVIAADMGLTKAATVSQAWIDGVNISDTTLLTGSNDKIDLYHGIDNNLGSNIVGCQGRQTEIYKLANGTYSIVEINTYYGEVASVTAAKTDALGHMTKASITVDVYTDADVATPENLNYQTTGYAVDDTVLVTFSGLNDAGKPIIASVEAVAPAATGKVTAYSQRLCNTTTTIQDSQSVVVGTVTVGGNTYSDADKFYKGYPTAADSTLYNIYLDNSGNVIALVPVGVADTYAVINAIRWNSPNMGTTVGGYVTANLTLADGSVITDVVVAKINGKTPISVDMGEGNTYYVSGATPTVSNVYTQNQHYYGHLITYVVNADGNYELTVFGDVNCVKDTLTADKTKDMENVVITKGKSTIYGESNDQINVAYASDTTVFLYEKATGYGYDVYVGYNNAPSVTGAAMCYLTAKDTGIVTLAVVTDVTLTENSSFSAYLASTTEAYVKVVDGVEYNVYNMYKIGTTEVTEVMVLKTGTQPTAKGFYNVAVNKGVATLTLAQQENLGVVGEAYAGKTLDITKATTKVIENSIATTNGGNPNKNYSNMINAQYFLVKNGVITTGAYTDVAASKIIQVIYDATTVTVGTTTQTIYTPAYVYLADFTGLTTDTDQDVDQPDTMSAKVNVSYTTGTVTNANGVVLVSGEKQTVTSSTYTFVIVTGTTAPNVTNSSGSAVLSLIGSDTASGTYTYQLSNILDGKDITITVA